MCLWGVRFASTPTFALAEGMTEARGGLPSDRRFRARSHRVARQLRATGTSCVSRRSPSRR